VALTPLALPRHPSPVNDSPADDDAEGDTEPDPLFNMMDNYAALVCLAFMHAGTATLTPLHEPLSRRY
jgi:hypothetical protein